MAKRPSQPNLKPNASPDDMAACFSEYSELSGSIARIKQKIAVMFGRFENMGVDTKQIKAAYRMSQKDDPTAEMRSLTKTLATLKIIDFDAEGQGSFIKGLTITAPSAKASTQVAVARAHADGYNSGLAGGSVDGCKFNPGSEEYVSWRDGWEDGRADRLTKNPDADKVREAKPRGRPAGRKKAAAVDPIGDTAGSA